MKARIPRATEKHIALAVTQFLELQGWLVVRTEANAVTRGRGNGGIVARGEPDARAFKDDRVLHLEFKTEIGKLSEVQKQRHAYLKKFGIVVHAIRNLEDIQKVLVDYAKKNFNPR
jgi:enoyl-[acyl-carrier-protein] reductase (NADH)